MNAGEFEQVIPREEIEYDHDLMIGMDEGERRTALRRIRRFQ